jgi:hypothetical protein
MKNTYNFKIWNQYWEDTNLGIAEFLKRIEDPMTPKMTIYQENGQKYVGMLNSKLKNDPCGELYFDHYVYRGPFMDDCK